MPSTDRDTGTEIGKTELFIYSILCIIHHLHHNPGGSTPGYWIYPLLLTEDILQTFIAGICIPEVGLLREHKRSNYSITGRHVMHNLTWHFVMNNLASNLPFNHTTYHISFRSKDVFQHSSLLKISWQRREESVLNRGICTAINFPCCYFEFTRIYIV